MRTVTPSPLLKLALLTDAAVTAAVALLQLAALDVLAGWLALPRALLLESGLFMAAYAGALLWLARRGRMPVLPVQLIVAGNLGWALGCAGLLVAAAGVTPTALGYAYVGVQAVAVVAFALMEAAGLRASRPVAGTTALHAS